ncbi:MAG: FAD synthase [Candidatus Micrarchaeota archaeon]|nr:FAD synthase [Candidatus Micrarchaeota archaeon]
MRKVLAFGCFDILHMGHYTYLKNARKLGDKLIVVVARDSTIRKFKKREPVLDEESRRKLVESLKFVDSAVLGSAGDKYQIIKKMKPDVIALGYDQKQDEDTLKRKLKEMGVKAKVIRIRKSFNPKLYKSSVIIKRMMKMLKL